MPGPATNLLDNLAQASASSGPQRRVYRGKSELNSNYFHKSRDSPVLMMSQALFLVLYRYYSLFSSRHYQKVELPILQMQKPRHRWKRPMVKVTRGQSAEPGDGGRRSGSRAHDLTGSYAGALQNTTRNNGLNTQYVPSTAPSTFYIYLPHNTSLRGTCQHERPRKRRGSGIFPKPLSGVDLTSDMHSTKL